MCDEDDAGLKHPRNKDDVGHKHPCNEDDTCLKNLLEYDCVNRGVPWLWGCNAVVSPCRS